MGVSVNAFPARATRLVLFFVLLPLVQTALGVNLSGTVRGNDQWIHGATVTLWRTTETTTTEIGSTTTNLNGFYTFSVNSGTYKLRVVPPAGTNLKSAVAEGISVTSESVTRNFILQPNTTTHSNLTGAVFASDGVTSVSGITVFAGTYQSITGPLGRYELSLPQGTYSLGVRKPGSAVLNIPSPLEFSLPNLATGVEVTSTTRTVRNIVLPYFPELSGRVSGPLNANVHGALVTASTPPAASPAATASAFSKANTGADGRYSMRVINALFNMNVTPPANSGYQPAGATGVQVQGNTTKDFVLNRADTERPAIVGGPTVSSITDRSAFIEWLTNEPATTLVKYGTTAQLGLTTNTPGLTTYHGQQLRALIPNTTYYAQAVSRDAAENITSSTIFSFRTAPEQDLRPPVIVSGPAVVNITSNSAVIEWATNEPATSVVYFGTSPHLGQVVSDSRLVLGHRVVLRELSTSTTYYLRVGSSDAAGNGPTIAPPNTHPPLQFRTRGVEGDRTAPVITGGPIAVDVTAHAATISWTTNEPSTSEVTYSDGTITRTGSADGYVLRHAVRIANLASATTYSVTVASRDPYGNGPTVSHPIYFTTPALSDTAAPRIIEGPVAVYVSDRAAIIRWRTNEPSDSVVEFGTTTESLNRVVTNPGLVKRHDIALTDLAVNTTYYYRVKSKDGAGNGPTVSSVRRFRTKAEPDTRPPVITSGPLVLKRTDHSVTLFWRTDELSNSIVDYGAGTSLDHHYVDHHLVFEHVVTLSGLEASAQYQFVISSTDFSGNTVTASVPAPGSSTGVQSMGGTRYETTAVVAEALADSEPPVIIEGPAVVAVTNDAAIVRWVTDEIADSRVDYGPQPQPTAFTTGDVDLTTVHLVVLTNLSAATAYSVQVASSDSSGNGPVQSSALSFTTAAAPDTAAPVFVPAPSGNSGVAGQLFVSWGTSEYATTVIEYGTAANAQTNITSTDGHTDSHGLTLTNLAPSTTYYYTAVSVDIAGNEARSAPSSVTTAPAAAAVSDWSMY